MDRNVHSARARKRIVTPPPLRPEESIDGGLSARPDDLLEAMGVVVDETAFAQSANSTIEESVGSDINNP